MAAQWPMRVLRTVPNVPTSDPEQSRRFYAGLGYRVVMDLGWIVTLASPTHPGAQISLLSGDPSGLHPHLSVEVDDVDAAHEAAGRQELEIVYPLRSEPWGVRRFFIRDPGGTLVNVVGHLPHP